MRRENCIHAYFSELSALKALSQLSQDLFQEKFKSERFAIRLSRRMRGKRCWCVKSSSCDSDQLGRTPSALFHELEAGKSSLDPQLLSRLRDVNGGSDAGNMKLCWKKCR